MTTQLQDKMIVKMARSEFTAVNGAKPASNDDVGEVWANCIISSKEDGGVMTSLQMAGLAMHSGDKGSDATVSLTDAGFAHYLTLEDQ